LVSEICATHPLIGRTLSAVIIASRAHPVERAARVHDEAMRRLVALLDPHGGTARQ
jgi:hypothetical protein